MREQKLIIQWGEYKMVIFLINTKRIRLVNEAEKIFFFFGHTQKTDEIRVKQIDFITEKLQIHFHTIYHLSTDTFLIINSSKFHQ